MPARFLNLAQDSDDIELIHDLVRATARKEPRVAIEAERYVLAHYRQRLEEMPDGAYDHEDGSYTLLRGFDPDPEQCEERLAEAIKLAVAEVLEWRLLRRRTPEVILNAQTATDGKTTQHRPEAMRNAPPEWGESLREFYTKPTPPPVWSF